MIERQKWHKKVHNNNITFKNNFLSTFLKLSRKFIPLFASDGVCRAVFQRIYHQSITIIMTTTASPPSPSPKHNQHHSIFFQLLHSPHYPCLLIPDVLVGFREVNLFHYSLQWIAWFSFLVPKNAFEMEKMGKDLKQHFEKSQPFQLFCTFIVLVFQI